MSKPRCRQYCWVQTVIILLGLTVMCFWVLREAVTPDAIDCDAKGAPADCWKQVYDESGPVAK